MLYLTGWGWYSWLSYNAVVCYAHIKYDINKMPQSSDSSSIWHLWKWSIVGFELAFVNHLLVTVGFWVFVYPWYPWPMYFLDYARHGLPFLFLAVEFHLNHIEVDHRHMVASLIYVSCYLVNLITYHEYHDSYVYQEMHTFLQYLFTSLGVVALQLVSHDLLMRYNWAAHSRLLDKYHNSVVREETDEAWPPAID